MVMVPKPSADASLDGHRDGYAPDLTVVRNICPAEGMVQGISRRRSTTGHYGSDWQIRRRGAAFAEGPHRGVKPFQACPPEEKKLTTKVQRRLTEAAAAIIAD